MLYKIIIIIIIIIRFVKRQNVKTSVALNVDPATPRKRHTHSTQFWPMSILAKGWMDEDAAWYGSRPRPRPHCTRPGPSSRERGTAAPLFSAHVYCGHGRPSQLLLSSCPYEDGFTLTFFLQLFWKGTSGDKCQVLRKH